MFSAANSSAKSAPASSSSATRLAVSSVSTTMPLMQIVPPDSIPAS